MDIIEKRKRIIGARKWVEFNLPVALKIPNDSYGKILILSTIDSFAQMWGCYPKKNLNSTFCNFVLTYSEQRDLLTQVCPVTLFYHYLKDEKLSLVAGRVYKWDDSDLVQEANRLLLAITDEEKRKAIETKHTYIKLLYQLRNKLVHELNNIGTKIEFSDVVPSIAFGPAMPDELCWTLNYPRLWLYYLACETIYNFIDDCLVSDNLLGFLDIKRTIDLTWYD